MQKPIGIYVLTVVHFILFGFFLWFFIFLIPMVYDSNMPIMYEKISVGISVILNAISFLFLLRSSKVGWVVSLLNFTIIFINNLLNCLFSFSQLNLSILIICIFILVYLLSEKTRKYFNIQFRIVRKTKSVLNRKNSKERSSR